VFFSTVDNGDYCYYVGEGESGEADIYVYRTDATVADVYAIKVLSSDSGLEIPGSVSFAAGQTKTSFKITAPSNASVGDVLSFEIQLTGDNVNSSANSTDGTLRCEGTFYYYKKLLGAAYFDKWASETGVYNYMGDMRQVIWKLDNQTYLFKNFLGSEDDLKVIVDANGILKSLSYSYDLEVDVDEYGGYSFAFRNENISKFAANDYYETFKPKGDQRYIYQLAFYTDPAEWYSFHVDASSQYEEYFMFASHLVSIYGESEGIDKTFDDSVWSAFYVVIYSDASAYDFDSFPEIPVDVEYPEPVISYDAKDGLVPIQVFLNDIEVYLDTQYGTISTNPLKVVINDFCQTGLTLTLDGADGTFTTTVTDAGGNIKSQSGTPTYKWFDMFGNIYLYPWANGKDAGWKAYTLYLYDGGEDYTTADVYETGDIELWFWGSTYVYTPDGSYQEYTGWICLYTE
ncbi:MAG: hypothetical protein ACI3ZP_08370, partial [Candidatus Cryptobacteroides sp.]